MKVLRIFLNVDIERDKIVIYKGRQTGVAVRLVFEPLTRASGRCGAEIYQQRFVLFFSFLERLIGVFDPVDGHYPTSRM